MKEKQAARPSTGTLPSDLHSRLGKAHGFLAQGQYSHIILSDTTDIEYLSGFRSSNVQCLVTLERNLLFSDFRYKDSALSFCRNSGEWGFSEIRENDFSFFCKFIRAGSVAAYQSHVLSVDQYGLLKRNLPGIRFVKLPQSFDTIFQAKTLSEIQFMKRAAAIGDKTFDYIRQHIRIGMTEQDVAGTIDDRCRKLGSEKPSFDTIVLFGERAALPHGRPSDARLKSGDWVLCDFGCTIHGFCSDMTRTFVSGKASEDQKKIYDVVLRAQAAGTAAVAAGVKACDVDSRCRRVITKAGFGKLFGHATGHGVGLRIHEKPRISKTDTTVLQDGTVITVEPGIYGSAFGGVRIEDMVIVRDAGCEVITNAPRTLIETGRS